jgi:hypothetical protein
MQRIVITLVTGFFSLLYLHASAQENGGFSAGVDFVNRYIWRGFNTGGKSVHIQPNANFTYKNLELGAWGSYGISNNYKEYDFYSKFTFKNFGFSITEFNVPSDDPATYIELTLSYEGNDKIPVYGSFNRYILNDDAIYIDFGIRINSNHKLPMDLNLGFTPAENWYADKAAIVNICYTVSYNLPLSEKFSVPLFSSLTVNPDAEKVYFTAGISFYLEKQ